MNFVAPSAEGPRARIDPFDPETDGGVLAELDWIRSLDPRMAGLASRVGTAGTGIVRDRRLDPDDPASVAGVVDAHPLPGYDRVANLSMFSDVERARGGLVIEGFALLADDVLRQGARVIHQEILEMNMPVLRMMNALRLEPSARYREHAYVAGRWWDVFVFSFDEGQWRSILNRMPNNPVTRSNPESPTVESERSGG